MKHLLFIIIMILFANLKAQVSFNSDFQINKIDFNDVLRNIWLENVENEEIHATYYNTNLSVGRFVKYDLNGNLIDTIDFPNNTEKTHLASREFETEGNVYIINCYKTISIINPYMYLNYLFLEVLDASSLSFIDSTSYYVGSVSAEAGFSNGNALQHITEIEPILNQNVLTLHIGFNRKYFNSNEFDSYYNFKNKLIKYQFANETLSFEEIIDDCASHLFSYPEFDHLISESDYRSNSSTGMGQASTDSRAFNLQKLTYENPTIVDEILNVNGSVSEGIFDNFPVGTRVLTSNNFDYSSNGFCLFFKILDSSSGNQRYFINYSNALNDTSWISNDSYIVDDEIQASTCVKVNDQDHFVMYFANNQLEIRDLENGYITYHQYSAISPIQILKKQNGELLFITETDTGYPVYILSDDIYVSAGSKLVSAFDHLTNYPDPFNPSTTISFSLNTETAENTELVIYNLKGQKVKQLYNDQLSTGQHTMIWDGTDQAGRSVSSGIYFCKLKSGNTEISRKMLLLK